MLQFPLPDSGFGFHAQQAVEKLYKILLAHRNGKYPFSHDLKSLRNRVEASGISLPSSSFRLEDLSEYSGNARYDAPIAIPNETRLLLRQCIADLRSFVLDQIK
jgi:HEPN domain-containing protein